MATDLFRFCREHGEFRTLSGLPFLRLDLRYASDQNFCGRNLYQGEQEAWLHREATEALERSAHALAIKRPGFRFRIYDAVRPLSVQAELFAAVAGTPRQAYVADPDQGSGHNYGLAVDLGLEDAEGVEQDLGTPFDTFDALAQPQLEQSFFMQGRLNGTQLELRRTLRSCMARGGFAQHAMEWWHFDLLPLEQMIGRYPRVEGT